MQQNRQPTEVEEKKTTSVSITHHKIHRNLNYFFFLIAEGTD